MKRLALGIGILFLSLLLAACGAKGRSTGPVSVTPVLPSLSPTPTRAAFSYTPVPFEGLAPYPTPEGIIRENGVFPVQGLPVGVVAAEPTTEWYAKANSEYPYYLVQQKQIGRYAVRAWKSARSGWGIFTIADENAVLVQLEAEKLDVRHAGHDITGEGNPDVVVTLIGGGSYIWMATHVYDLGPRLTQVLDTPSVATDPSYGISCPHAGLFTDLEGDGVPEFVTCDDAPRWGFYGAANINPYAAHRRLVVPAVMAYEAGRGYVPAGPRFAQVYAPNIASFTEEAEVEAVAEAAEYSGASPTALVALAFNYLYSGQPERAWAEIDRLHKGPDKALVWSEILRQARESPFYLAAGALPHVRVPDYYTLRLVPAGKSTSECSGTPGPGQPTCEPEAWLANAFFFAFSQPVALLERGQTLDGERVAFRTRAWLDYELGRSGLMNREEHLQGPSADCLERCLLEVAARTDDGQDTRTGFIELDATDDFPGEVVRLDSEGTEVARWRLRGDLTWERVRNQ